MPVEVEELQSVLICDHFIKSLCRLLIVDSAIKSAFMRAIMYIC